MAKIISILDKHKKSIFISLLIYLVIFSFLIASSIKTPIPEEYDGFLVDFEDLEQLELPILTDVNKDNSIDDNKLNVAVNEALKDKPTSNPYDYYNMEEQSDDYKNELIKNALSEEEYDEYINKDYEYDVEDFKNDEVKNEVKKEKKESNYQGATYIKYNLKDRHDRKLIIPTYKCEGYGKVVVKIVVNKLGKVTKAEIISSSANGSDCLNNAALSSAKNSIFDKNINAPNKQTGTISYTFKEQ